MSSSADGELSAKDRKKSAHWTDSDTEVLINLLLRYKDSGRTADNGFKHEVWTEAASLLDAAPLQGGPKTADACKSRWQRLQRDYKAAKDMETMPGFSWDPVGHRLSASSEAWDAAAKQMDSYKYKKIHLPCFDSLAILCPADNARVRQRAKPRASLPVSDSNLSLMSLGMQSNDVARTQQASNGTTANGHLAMGHPHSNGHNHSPVQVMSNGHLPQTAHGITQGSAIQHQEPGMIMWGEPGGEVDGDGDFDTSFTMPDGQSFTIPPQKRMYDNMMTSSSATQSSNQAMPSMSSRPPQKKSRISSGNGNRSQSISQPSHPQQSPQHTSTHMGYHLPMGQQSTRSPDDFPSSSSATLVDPSMLHSPSSAGLAGGLQMSQQGPGPSHQQHHQTIHHQFTSSQPTHQAHSHNLPHPNQGSPSLLNKPTPTYFPSNLAPPPTMFSPEVTQAGLPDAQRRTEALIQLQVKEGDYMKDEDLVEVVTEFEKNIATCDTYLAMRKEGLRRMWLMGLVKRRKKS